MREAEGVAHPCMSCPRRARRTALPAPHVAPPSHPQLRGQGGGQGRHGAEAGCARQADRHGRDQDAVCANPLSQALGAPRFYGVIKLQQSERVPRRSLGRAWAQPRHANAPPCAPHCTAPVFKHFHSPMSPHTTPYISASSQTSREEKRRSLQAQQATRAVRPTTWREGWAGRRRRTRRPPAGPPARCRAAPAPTARTAGRSAPKCWAAAVPTTESRQSAAACSCWGVAGGCGTAVGGTPHRRQRAGLQACCLRS